MQAAYRQRCRFFAATNRLLIGNATRTYSSLAVSIAQKLHSLWSHAKAGKTIPSEKCKDWCLSLTPLKDGTADFPTAQKTLFVPVSKGIVIGDPKRCPNVSPPVPE